MKLKTFKNQFLSLAIFLFAAVPAFASKHPVLETVPHVDLVKYAGLWHQIAFFPTIFQGKCTIDTTAEYTLRDDGYVTVVNQCYKPNGTRKLIKGYAYSIDEETNAKLKVKFFWFAPAGDYYVIDLADDYSYAVVGEPKRKFLWILSRDKVMDKNTYDGILERAAAKGFDIHKLKITGKVAGIE